MTDATRQLYEQIRNSPVHAPFIAEVDASPRRLGDVPRGTLIAIAPAALYKEYRKSGADGRRVREAAERIGLRVETIPLEPTGSLACNAAIIVRWLQDCDAENVVLVSLSKGASDLKKALVMDAGAFARVSAWISIGGLFEGTPLAGWLLSGARFPTAFRALNRMRGVDLAFLAEVDRRPGGPLDFAFAVPAHLRLLHLLGFPQPQHLTNWLARRLYRKLAVHGPNDGFMVLNDVVRWPGEIYPIWGADHYFRTGEDLAPLLDRTLCVAIA